MLSRLLSCIISLIVLTSDLLGISSKVYSSKELFADPSFACGFYVLSMETQSGDSVKLGEFTYSQDGANAPAWMIAQWNSKHCLWNERKQSDRYTITDGITKTVTYNPEDCSVSMRLNAAEVYGGTNIGFEIHGNYVIARLPSKIISSPHTG